MPDPYVSVDPRRLFPREVSGALPMQARLWARTAFGRLTTEDLQSAIAAGALEPLDDPDAVNEMYAQGW